MRQGIATLITLLVFLTSCSTFAATEEKFKCPHKWMPSNPVIDESKEDKETVERWRILKKRFTEREFYLLFRTFPKTPPVPSTRELAFDEKAAKALGISPVAIKETLAQFPVNWANTINSITFLNQVGILEIEAYGMDIDYIIGAACFREENGKLDLYFFKDDWTDAKIRIHLAHEIGHSSSWVSHFRSLAERINLAYDVLQRVENSDRFTGLSPMYEKNFGKMRLRQQMDEYWAEIVRFYFTDRDKLPETDKKLVEKYLN